MQNRNARFHPAGVFYGRNVRICEDDRFFSDRLCYPLPGIKGCPDTAVCRQPLWLTRYRQHAVPTAKPVQPTKMDHKVEIIEKAIHQDKLFLESNINLERFAEQIGLKPRDISAILKMHYQSNFFEFINRYRVEEAKRLLVLPELKEETILEIIYKSGFNSPSAFHRFFKRMVGLTPTEYRQRGSAGN